MYTIFQLIILIILFGAFIALFRGHLNLFKIIPIPSRKIAIVFIIICFIIIGITPASLGSQASSNDSESEQEVEEGTKENNKEVGASEEATNAEDINQKDETTKDGIENKKKAEAQDKSSDDTKGDASSENDNSNDEAEKSDEQPLKQPSKQSEKAFNEDNGKVSATVTGIVDGDTIDVNVNGKQDTVRLLLVDTPETKHPSKPVQKFGPEASQFAMEKLSGKQIKLEYDGPKRDKYDRLLAYIWVDGKMFNQMLLEQGLGRYAYVYDPPYNHSSEYMKTQDRAMSQGKGIWSINGYVTSDGFDSPEQKETQTASASQYNSSSNESSSNQTSSSTQQQSSKSDSSSNLKYNPNGPDRDCGDFDTHAEAQAFFEAAGGPASDPHRLDGNDNDGLACESLP
ncbi:thermonuclease family protein [Pontibacillus salicampi]|uniref:Thermonuclease family protein n=1 Tax=Pontibacillus salicampi TaxID=1449801 RepID=A0ABV6LNR6_9BACI